MLHPVSSTDLNQEGYDKVEEIQQQLKLLNSGIIVNIVEVDKVDEESSAYNVKAKLKASVDSVPVFSTITLKLTKQALEKLCKSL